MEITGNMNRDGLSKVIWKWLPVLLVLLGSAIRIRIYLFNRSLWSDEALLALNFLHRDLSSLLTAPLDYKQAAPLGFIVVVRVFTVLLGQHDYVLRLLPFAASMGALGCGCYLSRQLFQKNLARMVFLTLLTFSPILLYYNAEFKHYTLDVFFALALLCGYVAQKWRLVICAMAGAAGIWFSHPVVFIMAGVGLAFFVEMLRARSWATLPRLAALAGIWLLSFAVNFVMVLDTYSKDDYLRTFWESGYAPLPVSGDALGWYFESLTGLVHMAFRQCLPAPLGMEASWFYPWTIVLSLVTLLGMLAVYIRKPALAFILALAVLANLLISGLEIYPFRNRLILYLVPVVYLAVAFFVQACLLQRQMAGRLIGMVAAVLLVGTVLPAGMKMVWQPASYSDMKTALEIVSAGQEPNDMLAINIWADAPFKYYKRYYSAGDLPLVAVVPDGDDATTFMESLAPHQPGRVWIVHMHDPSRKFYGNLRRIMNVQLVWEGDNSHVYLLINR